MICQILLSLALSFGSAPDICADLLADINANKAEADAKRIELNNQQLVVDTLTFNIWALDQEIEALNAQLFDAIVEYGANSPEVQQISDQLAALALERLGLQNALDVATATRDSLAADLHTLDLYRASLEQAYVNAGCLGGGGPMVPEPDALF